MVRKNCALSEVLPTVWSLCRSLIYSIFSACQGFWIKVSTAPQKMKGVPGLGYVCVCLQLGPALCHFGDFPTPMLATSRGWPPPFVFLSKIFFWATKWIEKGAQAIALDLGRQLRPSFLLSACLILSFCSSEKLIYFNFRLFCRTSPNMNRELHYSYITIQGCTKITFPSY